MKKSGLDFEKGFDRILEEFRRRFPECRWTLGRGCDLMAACVCVPDGRMGSDGRVRLRSGREDGMMHEEKEMVLGLTRCSGSSPEMFLEGVLKDVGPRLLGTEAGFSSLEELDLFLESVGRGAVKMSDEVRKIRRARILAALEVRKRWFGEGVFKVISPAKGGGVEVWWLSSECPSLWSLEFSGDSEEELESGLLEELSRRLGSGREKSWEELEMYLESVGRGGDLA